MSSLKRFKRLKPEKRKQEILQAAVDLAVKFSYMTLTRNQVSKKAKVSTALVNQYFGTMQKLKTDVMVYSVNNKILRVIGQGLLNNDPIAQMISPDLREQVRKSL